MRDNDRYDYDDDEIAPEPNEPTNDRYGDVVAESTNTVAKGDTDDGAPLSLYGNRKKSRDTDVPPVDYTGIFDGLYPDPIGKAKGGRMASGTVGKHPTGNRREADESDRDTVAKDDDGDEFDSISDEVSDLVDDALSQLDEIEAATKKTVSKADGIDLPGVETTSPDGDGDVSDDVDDGEPIYDDQYINFIEQFEEAATDDGAEAAFSVIHAYLEHGGSITDPVPDMIAWAKENPDAFEG